MSREEQKTPWYERWFGISFGQSPSVELPGAGDFPPSGRSSIETSPGGGLGAMPGLGYVQPPFNLDMLRTLKKLWLRNPDFSQFVTNLIALSNTGHSITVDTKDSSKAEAVMGRLNDAAQRLYKNGCGVDGLMNAYIGQIAYAGALSSEDVVDLAGKRVAETVLVPVDQIRFRYEDGAYVPKQMAWSLFGGANVQQTKNALGLIDLNPLTYSYSALQNFENSPYAKPLASAAVEMLTGPQADAIDNIKWIVRKLGILGLVAVSLTKPPKKAGQSDSEYQSYAKKYLAQVRAVLDSNFNKGLLVTFNDQKVDHANVASNARGAADIFNIVEEQVFSGMGSMGCFHGRNYTTTETFADVVYYFFQSQGHNVQRLCKRRQERTYRLDVALAGIEADISIAFNAIKSRNELQSAQAEQTRQELVMEKVRSGAIEPDAGAQELGYEKWFDPQLITPGAPSDVAGAGLGRSGANVLPFSATFRFDRQSQRYRFVTSRIEVASAAAGAGAGSQESGVGGELVDFETQKKRRAA